MFEGFFAPYTEQKTDQERVSFTLSIFLRVLIAVTVIITAISIVTGLLLAALWSSVGGVITVLLLLMTKRGHSRLASVLLVVTWLAIAVAALATGDGIHDIAVVLVPAVLITASLLLSRSLFSVMAVMSVVAVVVIGAAEVVGIIETPFSEPGRWGDVANVAIILGCVAILIRFLTETLHLSLEHARRNERSFREVFNATREAIIVHDSRTGEIRDANEAFLAMAGLNREQATKMAPADFYGRNILWDEIRQTEADPLEVLECDLPSDGPEGRRIEVSFRRSIIGDQRCILAVARDITERRRLEVQLRQSEKMQAVGQLAGGIAHDFNNQLVGIVGYADILRTKLADRPELVPYTGNILRSAGRASDLTAHLLAFARKGKFLTTTVDLHDIITEVASLLERSIEKRVVVRLDLDAATPTTLGDPSQLQNCFLNLALNARDAMPSGGELRFQTSIVHLDADYCRRKPYVVAVGDYIEVEVSDTGFGMNRQVIERIFEPFFTTKEKDQGTGMGLAAVYGTIKNHGGSIDVVSEEGRGTTFTVHLPLLKEPGIPQSFEPEPLPDGGPSGAHILLVDDEEVVCNATAEILRYLGYRVSVGRNGEEAVGLYERSGGDIDLVILDMNMPVMGGGRTFDALKEIDPTVRVLLSSGYSLDGGAQEIMERGALGFVQKPFLKNDLDRAVREVLTTQV